MAMRKVDLVRRSPENAARARACLQSIHPFSVEDDPNFVFSQRILRAIAHFKMEQLPLTNSLVHLHLKHTFLMDAKAVSAFIGVLQRLEIDFKNLAFEKLEGRVEQLCDDFSAREVGVVLCAFSSPALAAKMTDSALKSMGDLGGEDLVELLLPIAMIDPISGRLAVEQQSETLVSWVEGPQFAAEHVIPTARLIEACGESVCRRLIVALLSTVQRRLLDDLNMDGNLALLKMVQNLSFRHERVMLRLASRVCHDERCTRHTALAALRCLAHFFVAAPQLYDELAAFCSGKEVAAMSDCFCKARLEPTVLFRKPLGELCGNIAVVNVKSLLQIVQAASNLRELDDEIETNLDCVVSELQRRKVKLVGLDVSVLCRSVSISKKLKELL
jgi:hypothetical protein